MFVGHPRSGHSLVGSLLNAHPEIVIAHELDALRFVGLRFSRDQLFELLLQRDAQFARAGHRTKSGYEYVVPGGWQGRFSRVRVVGDKKGGASTGKLGRRPQLLDQLRRTAGVPVRLLNVTRNPFDNIATVHRRSKKTLEQSCDAYFRRCRTVSRIKDQAGDDLRQVRYESFLADPQAVLRDLCRFLGVEASNEYLSACVSIVRATPHRSRHDVVWPEGLVASVTERMADFDFLEGYSLVEPDSGSS